MSLLLNFSGRREAMAGIVAKKVSLCGEWLHVAAKSWSWGLPRMDVFPSSLLR